MQYNEEEERESLPTMAQIVRNFNNTVHHRYPGPDSRPTMDQRMEIFNEVTGGGWSVEFEKTSDRGKSALDEIIRSVVNMGDSPRIQVKAKVTILTRDGAITREATAQGPDDGPDSDHKLGNEAFIRAILTLAQTARE